MPVPVSDPQRLLDRLRTAARLAPIGGRGDAASPAAPSLAARVRSRLAYWASLNFTARQKRLNLELVELCRSLAAAADAQAAEVDRLRADHAGWLREAADLRREAADLRGEAAGLRQEAADLRREVAGLRVLVEPLHHRPGTLDELVFGAVAVGNEYRLPDHLDARDVVVDVGCHVGSFAYACLVRGVGRVVGFEASPDNHPVAVANLSRFGPRADVRHAAVWRSDRPPTVVRFTASHVPENTGAGNVLGGGGVEVPAVPLDDVLVEAAGRAGRRVRLLKIDCEGSEYPILLTSRRLDLVDEIAGEYHVADWEPTPEAVVEGYPRRDTAALAAGLTKAGFEVEFKAYTPGLGAFFARRAG